VNKEMQRTRYRAVRLATPGQPLVDETLEMAAPGPDEVIVRVRAAGICHSDAHYRAGLVPASHPCTPGHEVAGIVERIGRDVAEPREGERVCLHYLVTCGECPHCRAGTEQFCARGEMIGKHRDGGYAELIRVPAQNALPLPDGIPFEHGAILMCSTATALHALRKARLANGETVAVFGAGGLGQSAIQLARLFGAGKVYAVDVNAGRLDLAKKHGAVPVDAGSSDATLELHRLTGGRGVDISLELVGLPRTMEQAVECLAIHGRAALAGLGDRRFSVAPYRDVLCKEAEIVGVSDHLGTELSELIGLVVDGRLDLSDVVTRTLPLDAAAINAALDALARGGEGVRSVIRP
jgi:2-desacetyl-2-hydroxyethyl bacteriochlorophyllide A dehydrogenase